MKKAKQLLLEEKPLLLLLLLFLVAFLPRFVFGLATPANYSYDEGIYDLIAKNVLGGKGFCYAPGVHLSWRPPLYPLFLVFIYSTLGSNIFIVRSVQAILGTLTCLVVYFIGKKICNKQVGALASLITAIHPWLIWYTKKVMTETLYTSFLALCVLFALRLRESKGIRDALMCGLLVGLASLTRPTALLVPVIIATWLLISGSRLQKVFRDFLVISIVAALVIVPWTVRNYLVHGEFVLISTNGGYNFYRGNNPQISQEVLRSQPNPQFIFAFESTPSQQAKLDVLTEAQQDKQYYLWGFDFIRTHPRRFLSMLWWKFLILGNVQREGFSNPLYGPAEYSFFFLALAGILLALYRQNRNLMLPLLVTLSIVGTSMAYFPTLRFRVPIIPYLAIFAAHVIQSQVFHISKSLSEGL